MTKFAVTINLDPEKELRRRTLAVVSMKWFIIAIFSSNYYIKSVLVETLVDLKHIFIDRTIESINTKNGCRRVITTLTEMLKES